MKRYYVIARARSDGAELGTVSKHWTKASAKRRLRALEAQRLRQCGHPRAGETQPAGSFYHDVMDVRTERWL